MSHVNTALAVIVVLVLVFPWDIPAALAVARADAERAKLEYARQKELSEKKVISNREYELADAARAARVKDARHGREEEDAIVMFRAHVDEPELPRVREQRQRMAGAATPFQHSRNRAPSPPHTQPRPHPRPRLCLETFSRQQLLQRVQQKKDVGFGTGMAHEADAPDFAFQLAQSAANLNVELIEKGLPYFGVVDVGRDPDRSKHVQPVALLGMKLKAHGCDSCVEGPAHP